MATSKLHSIYDNGVDFRNEITKDKGTFDLAVVHNDLVTLVIYTPKFDGAGSVNLGSLPEKYQPRYHRYGGPIGGTVVPATATDAGVNYACINIDGSITCYCSKDTTYGLYCYFIYRI